MSQDIKIRIAVIGAGRWGNHLIRNFAQHPQAKLVAVVDSNRNRLTGCQKQLNLDSSVVLATKWEEVRKLPEIDAVAIVTPATTHYHLIVDALQLGYHVLAEKPLTLNPAECLELNHLAQTKQRQLFVDHTYLFHPAVIAGKEVIASAKVGELRYGYATRTHLAPVRQDVDALWDLAIHDLCIFNHWLGETPVEVQATGKTWLQPQIGPGLADLVWLTLTYANGFQAYIHLSWLNPDKQRRLCVVGSQGTLIFDEMNQESPLTVQQGYFEPQEGKFIPLGQSNETIATSKGEPLRRMCDRFLTSVRHNKPDPISSGWVGTKLVHILSCASQSLAQGGKIISVPQLPANLI